MALSDFFIDSLDIKCMGHSFSLFFPPLADYTNKNVSGK